MYYKIIIIYISNIQAPQGHNNKEELWLNISFISSKDEGYFKTTAEGLIKE